MSVIAAFELHHVLALGVSAGEADRRHRRFRPGADETYFLHVRKRRENDFGEIGFRRSRGSETCALLRSLGDRFDDRRRGVAENLWTPGADVIDVLIAVRIPESRSLAA